MKSNTVLIFLISILLFSSCQNNDEIILNIPEGPEELILTENIEVYKAGEIENSLVLGVLNGDNSSFLVDKTGVKLKEWAFDLNLGNDLELLPNGKLLGLFKPEVSPIFSFGGYGGVVQIINTDNTIDWEYNYVSDNYLAHHDVEMLPNGNVLIMVWERIKLADAKAMGINAVADVFPEALIEVNPNTDLIVWEWHAKEHFVQDTDATLPNFGTIANHPQRINANYALRDDGDIMHANGIDYDPENDVIFLSVNFFSEVWVIDHSTTIAESSSNIGGNYGKGGDLIYRFGNPQAYNNTKGSRLFNNNHFPNFLQSSEPGAGNILIFNNGSDIEQSTVYELEMPATYNLIPNTDNEPNVVWSFTDTDLFNGRISGAVRLQNGNTLICEGDYGFWEVTIDKEIVWKYNGEGNFWRGYSYLSSDSAILSLGL